jgi:1,4-alpha-glucan branching enzyme
MVPSSATAGTPLRNPLRKVWLGPPTESAKPDWRWHASCLSQPNNVTGRAAQQFGNARIVIEGHTDASMRGKVPADMVKELSLERAGAVRGELIKQFNIQVHHHHPGVLTIAEESTAWAGVSRPTYVGGLGFSLKWNMGWMNDTLRYMRHDPVHRKYHHDELTFSLIYAFHENFVLPFSHDEVVHGKGSMLEQMPGDLWQKFANLRLLYAYMWCHPGKKLLFMGGEFGQWAEWNFDESLQWHLCQYDSHRGLAKAVADLNHLVRRERALHELDFDGRGFEWIDCHNWQDSVLVFVRRAADPADFLLVCCNFTPVPRPDYRIGVPHAGQYDEVFNSDSAWYGGGNVGNAGGLEAGDQPHHGREHSLLVSLPPLAAVVLKPRRSSAG